MVSRAVEQTIRNARKKLAIASQGRSSATTAGELILADARERDDVWLALWALRFFECCIEALPTGENASRAGMYCCERAVGLPHDDNMAWRTCPEHSDAILHDPQASEKLWAAHGIPPVLLRSAASGPGGAG